MPFQSDELRELRELALQHNIVIVTSSQPVRTCIQQLVDQEVNENFFATFEEDSGYYDQDSVTTSLERFAERVVDAAIATIREEIGQQQLNGRTANTPALNQAIRAIEQKLR